MVFDGSRLRARALGMRSTISTLFATVTAVACVAGCPGATATGPNTPGSGGLAQRDTELKHEPCDVTASDAVRLDANGDGRPEIIRVVDGARELCRAVDINMDGTIDVFVYYDEAGQVRRRESGFDRDARPDEVAIYQNGILLRKERETNNDTRIDTWDYYEHGRLAREERDSTGDGYVDQWWVFNRPDNPKCAVVSADNNGDGKPDEGSLIDLCKDEQPMAPTPPAPPAAPAPAPATTAPAPATTAAPPTESDAPATTDASPAEDKPAVGTP